MTASLSQQLQGSVLYNRSSGALGFKAGPSVQRAGLTGRVFLDQNGNGLHDPNEPGLSHVRVQVGTTAVSSDSSGSYQVWDMIPFEPVQVAVDSLSFTSPLWLAPTPVVRVIPGPNQFTAHDIPIIVGSVLEGQVSGPNGEAAPGGVIITATRSGSSERRRITTFSDGAFYMLGLPPGEYDLSFDPGQLARFGYAAAGQHIVLPPATDATSSLKIVLQPCPCGATP
jgi:hypothetical protein